MNETNATMIQHINSIRLFLEHGLPSQMASGTVDASNWSAIIDAYRWIKSGPAGLPTEISARFEESLLLLQNQLNTFLDLLRRIVLEKRTNEYDAKVQAFEALQSIRASYSEKSSCLISLAKQPETSSEVN